MANYTMPPWQTKEAKEALTKRFYNMTPIEFEYAYSKGELDFAKNTKMLKTLLLWYPELVK